MKKINPEIRHLRRDFSKYPSVMDVPNLIAIQRDSFKAFIQEGVAPEKHEEMGLHAIFKTVFPIYDYNKTSSLEYINYRIEPAKYDPDECRDRGMTYAAPMRVRFRLVIWDVDQETGDKSIRDAKEQEVYFGEIPIMTDQGTFIVNGAERVVVSQLHRSPGVFFQDDGGSTHASGKKLFSSRIIPNRGSWVDLEFDHKDIMYVRIDRKRKITATILLKALGYSVDELLKLFYPVETIVIHSNDTYWRQVDFKLIRGTRTTADIVHPETNEILVKKNKRLSAYNIKKLKEANITELPIGVEELETKVLADDIVDQNTGIVLVDANNTLSPSVLEEMKEKGINEFHVLYMDDLHYGPFLRNTLLLDKEVENQDDAVVEIYKKLRPGDPSTSLQARAYFNSLFFSSSRYDLSKVGRLKMNYKLQKKEPLEHTTLTRDDFVEVIRYLLNLKMGVEGYNVDNIDELSNRRVRAVGELLENQYRVGLVRMERAIKEKMSMSQDIETMMPHDLVNAKPVSAVLNEYLGASQLSQFMDQTNPLSEITNKRRLSALGPSGLTRERAGFEVRDVHESHYGRLCPIETPEGQNIGLISSLAVYARVNDFGFIETPYRIVKDRKVTDDIRYCTAMEENHVIAQAGIKLDEKNRIEDDMIPGRVNGEFQMVSADEVELTDVATGQLVSAAASLITFLEHDDANRALMGSNMQRQGVPLYHPEAPLIGTGMEWNIAKDSGSIVMAKRDGVVENIEANRIIVSVDEPGDSEPLDIYKLIKYRRSNQNTVVTQHPIVKLGDHVARGQVIADGAATQNGELALGKNVLIAFIPWNGYNFEDAILLSERLVSEDVYTSLHIEEKEIVARDTKLGAEEITRDIPNVGEDALKNLDEDGIIRLGVEVKTGDILVGKVTPKTETQLSPEEKLLRAIFGEKAGEVKDSSLRVPPGIEGVVVGAKVFSLKTTDIDEIGVNPEEKVLEDARSDIIIRMQDSILSRMGRIFYGHKLKSPLKDGSGKPVAKKGAVLDAELIKKLTLSMARKLVSDDEAVNQEIAALYDAFMLQKEAVDAKYSEKIKRMRGGDDLPPGVLKKIKVFIAIKRKLQVGDKMAGRHGNKGVVSRIMPVEDMPYMADGTPVDIVLNPLGVPSRMNVGQLLETHLGWASKELGHQIGEMIDKKLSMEKVRTHLLNIFKGNWATSIIKDMDEEDLMVVAERFRNGVHMATHVFDGASEAEIDYLLTKAGLPTDGKTILFDGRTGEPFSTISTVGYMYVLKLHHLVDEKIHARSTGPYSLVTQQPLGGKAQFGGQRLGEMEVWAMEAYGAAYALQEFLTVKSDDVEGRTATYESIVKGDFSMQPGLPESFKVLMKELMALAIDVRLIDRGETSRRLP